MNHTAHKEPKQRSVALYGSTGSIGRQTLEVIAGEPEAFSVSLLMANSSWDKLVEQARQVRPTYVALSNDHFERPLASDLPKHTELISAEQAIALGSESDIVLNAVGGFAGLPVTQAALLGGRRLAIANKESIIAGGDLVCRWRQQGGGELIPVDSEHSAIFQCIAGAEENRNGVSGVVLTASGGPFRGFSADQLSRVTRDDALRHPTWSMGAKITVDSSTLVNKGLEVIEAHFLFDIPYDDIEVVVHPQSIVHSFARFRDGSSLAQLSLPDMRLPISYALHFPARGSVSYGALDFSGGLHLEFEPPDLGSFIGLGVAYEAGRLGGGAPCWFNAANEVFVQSFLQGEISWSAIGELLADSLESYLPCSLSDIGDVLDTDARARSLAIDKVKVRRGV